MTISLSKVFFVPLVFLVFSSLLGQTVKIRTEIIDYQKVFDPNTLFSKPVEHRNYQISDLGYSSNKVLIGFDIDLFGIGTDDWVNIAIELDRPEYPVAKDLNEDGIPDFFQIENAFETEVNGTVRATWDAVDADYQGEKISIPAGFASFSLQGSRLSRAAGQSVVGIERTINLLEENMIEEYDWEVRSLADGIASIAISPVEAEGSISLDLDYGQYACSLNVVGDALGNEIVLSGRGNLQWEEDRLTLSGFPLPSAGNPTLGQTHSFLSETSLPETITFEKKDNLYQALVTKENLRFWIEISEFDPTAPRMDLDSNSTESGTLWRTSSWLGSYWQGPLNWFFHSSMGWLYHGSTDELGSWLWNENLGWFWMTPEHETFAFLDSGNCWVFLDFSSYPSLTYDFIHEKWLPLSNYLHGKPDRIRRQAVEYSSYIQSAAEDANLTDEQWILNSLEAAGVFMELLEGHALSDLYQAMEYSSFVPLAGQGWIQRELDGPIYDVEDAMEFPYLRREELYNRLDYLKIYGYDYPNLVDELNYLLQAKAFAQDSSYSSFLAGGMMGGMIKIYSLIDQYGLPQQLYNQGILEKEEYELFGQLANDSNYREFNASREEIANFLGFQKSDPRSTQSIFVNDLDGDGLPEIVFERNDGEFLIYENKEELPRSLLDSQPVIEYSNDWSIANENDLPLFAWNLAKQISLPVETAASAHQLGLHFDLAKQALDQNVSLENAKLAQDSDLPIDRAKEALALNLEFRDAVIAIQENLSFKNAKQAVDLDLSIPQARKALDAGISITEGKQAYTVGLTFDNAKLALDYNVTFANAKLAHEENLAIELVPAALAVNLSFADAAEAIQKDLSFEQATEALDLQLSLSDAQDALQGGLSLVDAKEALDREISFSTAKQALDFLLPLARVKEAETENLSLSEAGEAHVIGLSFSFAHQALDLNLTFSDARDASVFGLNAEEAKIALHLGMSESEMAGHVVGGGTLQSLLEKEASDADIEVNYFLETSLYDLNASKAQEAYALGIGAQVAKSFNDLKAASFLIEGLSLGLKEEQMLEAMLYFSESKDFQELIGFDWQIVIEAMNQGIEIKDIDW